MPSYLVSAKEAFVPTELYTPPIESIGEILRIKQSRYDQGFNQVNSMYRNIMDSEILSQHGNAKRKQFMDQADQAIKQLSNVDLSMPENVAMGENVFKPFWEDQNLVREIGVIKNTRKELSFAESLRTSTDEKVRADYNVYSVMDQQNLLKEIAESDPDDIKQIGPRAYTKKVDISKEMDEGLKALGITNAQVKEIPNGGGYKVVDQFGKESVLPLTDYFMNSLSSDARAYLQTMGRVTGRNAYEIALESTNGDKVAARGIVANNIIAEQRNSIEKNMIPEFTSSISEAESRIRTIMLKRQSEGSQLTEQDATEIEGYKNAVLGYKKKLADYSDLSKQLGDKNSEKYQQYFSTYQTSNGYNNAYTETLMGQHANGWAKSRANILGSTKVEADQAWKNKEDVITARMTIEAGLQKNDDNNDVKLQIAEWNKQAKERKAGGGGTGGTGSGGGAGQSQQIFMGKSPTGLKPISKATQYQAAYTQLSTQAGVASIRLFDKTLNEQAQLGFTGKLYDEIEKGNGDKPFFKDKNSDDYKAFSKAMASGILKLEPGRKYTWTHNEVYDLIAKNVNNYIKTEEGIIKMGMTNADGSIDRDFQAILRIGDAYNSLRDVNKEVHNKIYSQDKYKNFVTNDGGMDRLKTVEELNTDSTIAMRDQNGVMQNVSIKDLSQNANNITVTKEPMRGMTYAGAPVQHLTTVNIGDKTYTHFSNGNEMELIKNGRLDEVVRKASPEMVAKLEALKGEFDKDFEKLSPSLSMNIPDNANMFQLGDLRFLSNDEKTIESGEIAAMTLLGPENRKNRMAKFIGVEPEDLKEDSPFMRVVDAVSNNLKTFAVSKDGPTLDMIPYDIEAGQAAYKIRINRKQLIDALGVSESDFNKDPELLEAAKKFESDGFRIVAPDNIQQPGDLITGYSPVDVMTKQKGFTTDASLDKMGVGGFSIKPEYKGGYTVTSWNYRPDANGNMIKDMKNLGQVDEAVNTSEMIDLMYKSLFDAYKMTKQARKANPTAPVGNISIEETRKTLQNLGLNVN